ncbi:MAG: hypothetical protein AAFV33_23720 [Chloroflexota bacterium]
MTTDYGVEMPPRIRVEQRGNEVVIKLAASALPGRIVCGLAVLVLIGVYTFVLVINDGYSNLMAEDGGVIILAVSLFFSVIVLLMLLMRGFNVSTFTLGPDRLTRRTFPIGLGWASVPRDEIYRVATDGEGPNRRPIGQEGIRIRTFSIDVFDADNKRRSIKGSVRGVTHSLFIALVIAETYDLPSVDSFRERIEKTRDLNPILRYLVD